MLCVDRYIKRSPELFYFYPNVNKRFLRFIEESSENRQAAPSFYPRIRPIRSAPAYHHQNGKRVLQSLELIIDIRKKEGICNY